MNQRIYDPIGIVVSVKQQFSRQKFHVLFILINLLNSRSAFTILSSAVTSHRWKWKKPRFWLSSESKYHSKTPAQEESRVDEGKLRNRTNPLDREERNWKQSGINRTNPWTQTRNWLKVTQWHCCYTKVFAFLNVWWTYHTHTHTLSPPSLWGYHFSLPLSNWTNIHYRVLFSNEFGRFCGGLIIMRLWFKENVPLLSEIEQPNTV